MEADHAASGVAWWPAAERVARYREAVHVVDQMLRHEVTTLQGDYYGVENAEMCPRPVQRPRPPLTIPAHFPSMLRVAAEYAETWSSWSGYHIETEPQMFAATRDRTARFDDLCAEVGRDPKRVGHSLVCFPPLTPWESLEYFRDMVGRYNEIGIDEFVVYWPQSWRDMPGEDAVFEEVARQLPVFRMAAG
jgi:alkanesulfonate monooxygenase SsuD/methylene tetrahydromethanopterin reductase-like flavin-dependent oxidoreductase (luciferase family)